MYVWLKRTWGKAGFYFSLSDHLVRGCFLYVQHADGQKVVGQQKEIGSSCSLASGCLTPIGNCYVFTRSLYSLQLTISGLVVMIYHLFGYAAAQLAVLVKLILRFPFIAIARNTNANNRGSMRNCKTLNLDSIWYSAIYRRLKLETSTFSYIMHRNKLGSAIAPNIYQIKLSSDLLPYRDNMEKTFQNAGYSKKDAIFSLLID